MAIVTNLTPIDVSVNSNSSTTQFFNNYFSPELTVSSDQNSAIFSYFESFTGSKESAHALTSAVIYTSKSQNLDPMEVLNQFRQLPPGELNGYLCLFLNTTRIGTSLLGISNQTTTNKYVKRTIRL